MKEARSRFFVFLFLLLFVVPEAVFADMAPPPEIYSLAQEGQDIKIRYGYYGPGYDSGMKMTLVRANESGTKVLFENTAPPENEAEKTDGSCSTFHCVGDPSTECTTHPENCVDCDSDGTPECCGECWLEMSWSWVDECVPSGFTEYTISVNDTYDAGVDFMSIDVSDTGEKCLGMDSGADADSDGGKVTEHASSGGCSVSAVGDTNSATAGVLFLIGLAALLAGRKKEKK